MHFIPLSYCCLSMHISLNVWVCILQLILFANNSFSIKLSPFVTRSILYKTCSSASEATLKLQGNISHFCHALFCYGYIIILCMPYNTWGLVSQKYLLRTGTRNFIPHILCVGSNYLSLPWISAPGDKVLIYSIWHTSLFGIYGISKKCLW